MLVELNHMAHGVIVNSGNNKKTEVGDLGYLICSLGFDSGREIYYIYFPRIDRFESWFEENVIIYDSSI